MLEVHPESLVAMRWHIVMCKPNQNHIAFRHLARRGFDLFMPRHRVARRWRGRLFQDLRPIFGGYIFFAANPARPRWHEARTAPGVSSLIGTTESGPAVLPAEIVAGLMRRCDEEGCLLSPEEDFTVGDEIRIVSGPFHDFVTSIETIDPDRRLHVLLDLLGRPTRVQIDPSLARLTSHRGGG